LAPNTGTVARSSPRQRYPATSDRGSTPELGPRP
jgi:hypothetical protein